MSVLKAVKIFILSFAITMGVFVGFGLLAPLSPLADSVGHFRLHLAALLMASSLAILYFRHWKRGSILLSLSLIALLTIDFTSGQIASPDKGTNQTEISLLQLNIKYSNKSFNKITDLIKKHNTDILVFQEVSRKNRQIIESLSEQYPYKVQCPFASTGAVAVLSRLPLAGAYGRGCAIRMGLGWLRVKVGNNEVTVASIHLHWPYPFGQNDQIKALYTTLKDLPRPVIIAGDFNAAPWSHAVSQISEATRTEVAGGLRFTLQKSMFKGLLPIQLPIDHLLTPKNAAIREIKTGANVGSDHLPVISRLVLNAS